MSELGSEFGTPNTSDEDIKAILTLTAQDRKAGNFPGGVDPESQADREWQRARVTANPEQYWVFRRGDRVGAYIVLKNFHVSDEKDFRLHERAEPVRPKETLPRAGQKLLRRISTIDTPTGVSYVTGFVLGDWLSLDDHDYAADGLMRHALSEAAFKGSMATNIVLHDHDPLRALAEDYGFRAIGRGYAQGTPGIDQVEQDLYQRQTRVNDTELTELRI